MHFYTLCVNVFPQLKKPPLKCYPALEVIKCKHYLSYLLGLALIKADKSFLKLDYLQLGKYIRQAQETYRKFSNLKPFLDTAFQALPSEILQNLINAQDFNTISKLCQIAKIRGVDSTLFTYYDFVISHLEVITNWIDSEEFTEQYLKTNHPYPPLLNPKCFKENIDFSHNEESHKYPKKYFSYKEIKPDLAYYLNLPLPKCDIVRFESHGVGSVFGLFLNRIGVSSIGISDKYNPKLDYEILYNGINKGFRAIILRNYNSNGKRLHALIQIPNILTLNQVRDPISVLKCHMGIRRSCPNAKRRFNLSYKPEEVINTLVCYSSIEGLSSYPNLSAIKNWMDFRYMCFHDGLMYEEMINIKEVEFMDMSEIIGEKTIETMNKWARRFGVSEINDSDKDFYLKCNTAYGGLLPLNLYAHKVDIDRINNEESLSLEGGITLELVADMHKGSKNDISEALLGEKAHQEIRICANNEDFRKLQEDKELLQKTQAYLLDFLPKLESKKKLEDSKKLSETDVLSVLSQNKE
ncbi:MAG: DUF2972 domain-containing protein, partial [Helicobacter sp.]|nr:DUF2972 domain-containing protein [Helicobacter sp.]